MAYNSRPKNGQHFLIGKHTRRTISWIFLIFLIISCPCAANGQAKNESPTRAAGHSAKSFGKELQSPLSDICNYVVRNANRGELEKILIRPVSKENGMPLSEEAAKAFLSKEGDGYLIDINNDGAVEQVFVNYRGTLGLSSMDIFSLNGKDSIEVTLKVFDDVYTADDISGWSIEFLHYRGKTYLLTKSGNSLDLLFFISSDNQGKTVCSFGQRKRPMQSVTKSKNDKLCQAALQGKLSYVEYDSELNLEGDNPLKVGMYSAYPDEDAAFIDVDNDGKNELVVRSEYLGNCSFFFLTAMTHDGKSINERLSEKLPKGPCGSEVKPFMYGGKTYLDVLSQSRNAEYRAIFRIDGSSEDEVCIFTVRPTNYVLDAAGWIIKTAGYRNPWEFAISKPGTQMLKELIGSGRNVNEKIDKSGNRPLHLAVFNQRDDLLETLLKAGANPNVKNDIMTPLHEAVWLRSKNAISLLLNYGAKGNAGYGPLSEAMHTGSVDIFELLLKSGLEITDDVAVDSVLDDGDEAPARLRLLITYGLDVTRNYSQDIAVSGIEKKGTGVVSVGPDIKTKSISKTLIEWAQDYQHGDMIEILKEPRTKQDRKRVFNEINQLLDQAKTRQSGSGILQTLREVDAALNKAYKKRAVALSNSRNDILRKEQIAWIKVRGEQCHSVLHKVKLDQWYRFVAADDKRSLCVLELTRKRTEELSAINNDNRSR